MEKIVTSRKSNCTLCRLILINDPNAAAHSLQVMSIVFEMDQ